jgi:hypothetical protein
MKNNRKIFVQIAAYRDPELFPTIRDCIEKAKYPENLTFGICYQDENFETFYQDDVRFKFIKVPYKESKGACWARSKVNSLYNGEKFTLQIDSHMRFIRDWDVELEKMWEDLSDPKAVLTTYPAEYQPTQTPDQWKTSPHCIHTHAFKDYQTQQRPRTPSGWENRAVPYRAIHVAAGFIFSVGKIIEDVPYDPELYFSGEETALAVRLFTHGYNLFHPHKIILWHYYERKDQPKHWSDDTEWGRLESVAKDRLNCLLKRNSKYDLGKFGTGNERTLEDFQNYSGIDYKRSILHLDTIDAKEPPVDLSDKSKWSQEVKAFKQIMTWEFDKLDKCEDPRFWAFIFKDQNNHELYRLDVVYSNEKELFDGTAQSKEFEFTYYHPMQIPSIFIIWPYSESKHWLKNTIWKI